MALPTPREPECSSSQTAPVSSRQTSMKWLPEPSVPRWRRLFVFSRRGWSRQSSANSGARPAQAASTCAGTSCHAPGSRPPGRRPTGTACSIAARSGARLSGRSSAARSVRQASMPQPMSTPTAAGMMARTVGITEPMVAPMPKCTSGMTAMCGKTIGSRAALAICCRAASSTGTPRVHIFTGTPPGICSSIGPAVAASAAAFFFAMTRSTGSADRCGPARCRQGEDAAAVLRFS